uniref:F-box domain-containing protein n=1 Tax=Oryza punctata TaxID=4537 RepID=A0A0E0KPR4_ORYPU
MCDYVMRPANRQRADGGGGGDGNMDIPNDLVICEVLTRLPVKSLLRFRSVCRSWRNAVADPAFVRRHLELSRAATPPSVLAVHTRTDTDPDERAAPEDVVSFHRVRQGQSPAATGDAAAAAIVELMHEEALECADADLLTSHCDGLVAVAATAGKIFVCNPATNEFFLLPPGSRRGPSNETAALGFDPCTGRYVVTRCFFQRYDLHTDEDTGVPFLEYDIVHEVFVLGASGSGDWETTSDEVERELPNSLLRFAIHDGTFTVVPLPSGVTFMDVDFDSITELGGELCYAQNTSETAYNIWTLLLADPAPEEEEEEEEVDYRWSLRWRVDFQRPVDIVLPLAVAADGGSTLTVYEHRVGIHRFDGLENVLEKVVDVAAVSWGLVGQWIPLIAGADGSKQYGGGGYYGCKQSGGDYYDCEQCGSDPVYGCEQCDGGDYDREQCGDDGGGTAHHDCEQCGGGDYGCEQCGGNDLDCAQCGDGDYYCEQCGGNDGNYCEQCGGDEYDSEQCCDGDGDGDKETLGHGDHGDYNGEEWDDGADYDDEEEYWYEQDDRYKALRPALQGLFTYVQSLVKIN